MRVPQKFERGFTPVPEVKCRIEMKSGTQNVVVVVDDDDKTGVQLMERAALVYRDNVHRGKTV